VATSSRLGVSADKCGERVRFRGLAPAADGRIEQVMTVLAHVLGERDGGTRISGSVVDDDAGLLQPLIEIADIAAFEYEPITTCYLQYAPEIRLPRPLFALEEASGANCFGQFVFDRGQLDEYQAGLLAVVISAAGNALPHGHEALATAMAQQLANAFRMPSLSAPLWSHVISEKRAGFSCRPALARPANQTSAPGLLLAGDYTAGEYPATIEGAVRSGLIAARLSS